MGMKGLFFAIIAVLLISSVSALEYKNFASKEEFTDFLNQANAIELDLRDDYETSMNIKEQANKFKVDLNYYTNLKIYENIFSRFSWYITGFATGTINKEPQISFLQQNLVSGQKLILSLSNLNYLLQDKVVILAGGEIVAGFPRQDIKETSIEITIPDLEPGKYRFEIQGANAYFEFEISEVEIEKDPIIKLSASTIEPGDSIKLTGINILGSEKTSLNIIANGKIISSIEYPAQGVFEHEFVVNLQPGIYTLSLEGLESASAKLLVEVPYKEPRIQLSENLAEQGDKIIISGKNFDEENANLFVFGFEENKDIDSIDNILVNNGNFERFFDTQSLTPGIYKIYSKEFPSAEAEFKIQEPEQVLPILKTDMTSIEQGKEITIMGENFEEDGRAILILDNEKEISVVCNEQGRFSTKIDTSDLYIGTHKIFLQDIKDVYVPFSVEKKKPAPSMYTEEEQITEGQSFNLYGEKFFETGIFKLYIDNSYLGEISPDSKGNFQTIIKNDKNAGAYKITAKDSTGNIICAAAVNIIEEKQPVLKLITDPVYLNGEFKIKGFFFENRKVELKIDDIILLSFIPGLEGSFEKTISLSGKNIESGSYKLSANYIGSKENIAFTSINILDEKPLPEIKIKNNIIYEGDIVEISGRYFDEDKIFISVDQMYRDNIILSESGEFEYSFNLSSAGIMKGSYKLSAGSVYLPLNVYPRSGPILKVSKEELISGEMLKIYGSGFDDSAKIILIIDEGLSYNPITEGGLFEQEISTLETGIGIHKARVQGYDSVVSFNVKTMGENQPSLKLSQDEIIIGANFIIYGYNFDKEKESLPVQIGDVLYNAFLNNGNFQLSIDSSNLGLGYHLAEADTASLSFVIIEEYNPSIEIINQSVYEGQKVEVRGYNFPDSTESIDLIIDNVDYSKISINEGEFNTLIETNGMQEGYHVLGARGLDVTSGFYITKPEIKKPEIKLSHKSATMGMMLSVEGFNIPSAPQETLKIYLDSNELMQINYPEKGTFSFAFLVPVLEEGEHTIWAQGFSTAKTSFIYSLSGSTEPEIILSEREAMAGDRVYGVANNLPKGVVMRMDIIMNGAKIGNIQSSGIGSSFFSFFVPKINPGEYDLGLTGISSDMAEINVLAEPAPMPIKNYTSYEIEEIKAEVKNHMINMIEENEDESESNTNALQERILFGRFTESLAKDTCVPICAERCGQLDGCGSRCGAEEMNAEGKCGNPIKTGTSFEKGADQLSSTATGFMKFALGLE